VIDIFCLGCKRSRVQIPAARPKTLGYLCLGSVTQRLPAMKPSRCIWDANSGIAYCRNPIPTFGLRIAWYTVARWSSVRLRLFFIASTRFSLRSGPEYASIIGKISSRKESDTSARYRCVLFPLDEARRHPSQSLCSAYQRQERSHCLCNARRIEVLGSQTGLGQEKMGGSCDPSALQLSSFHTMMRFVPYTLN
jgi:hypothetical protein